MIKVSDYIAKRLAEVYKIKHVFMISGGGAMHLNDSFGQHMDYICNHHEQASAFAAEGYARYNQNLAVVNVTTGPGGINALNAVFGQWTDSVPVLYISGQVKQETTIQSCSDIKLRQLGDQEADIISIVKPIVKYAESVINPLDIKRILDKAVYIATSGRKGPVWIDIPINIQSALINEEELVDYEKSQDEFILKIKENQIQKILDGIKNSKRPLIVAGHGIRLSGTEPCLYKLLEKLNIPVVTTFNGFDLLPENHPLFIGRIGTIGQRAGNFALQNADFILFLGTRNNIRQVSYDWKNFAKNAVKAVVDIDIAELQKPTLIPDIAINADLKDFLPLFLEKIENDVINIDKNWINWCIERKNKYNPDITAEYKQKEESVNPYYFVRTLTKTMKPSDLLVAGNGSACVCLFQAGFVKENQRVFWNSGNASMGYDLPASIGLCIASGHKDTVCLAGDGSIMMNLQELQTVKHYNLPVKIFILNNDGYISIKQTQKNFFNGRLTASSPQSGVSLPNFVKIAGAFDIPSVCISSSKNIDEQIKQVLNTEGPVICEVILEKDYIFSPKLSSEKLPDGRMISKPLEDMSPFLDREEFLSNMIV